jgi:TonB family protein
MLYPRLALFRVGFLLISGCLLGAETASAQFDKLDNLASGISKELKPLKPHLVAVVDLRPPYGSTMPQAHYFAAILSSCLEDRAKNKFAVANHAAFDKDLEKLQVTVQSLVPGSENFRSAASHIGADILLTGTIEKRNDSYVLQITPVRVPDGIVLATHSQAIVASDFLDSFVTPFPADVAHADNKHKADMERITMPSCVHCPDPSYNDLARRNKINGVSVLEVLISPAGVAQQIRPVRLLGYGLDEQAYDVIKKWRFKPATLKADGTPVPAIVMIEVTFRLY